MNWYSTGKEAVKKQVEMYEERKANRAPFRILVQPMSSKKVIYLDDEGFTFVEHNVKNGQRYEQFTCLGANNGCPLCASGDKPYQITVFTVIDLTVWTDKHGEVRKNEKIIHALKTYSANALLDKKDRWGGLKGKQVIVSRKGDKDSSAGSDFEPDMKEGRIIQYKLDPNNEAYKPYDYMKIFAPKDAEFICQALGYSSRPAVSNSRGNNSYSRGNNSYSSGGKTAGAGAGAFQTVPEGLDEVDPGDIPANVNQEDVPF